MTHHGCNKLLNSRYMTAIDIWALGCILGEMLEGKPMFPGTSTMNQLEQILFCTGAQSCIEDIDSLESDFAGMMLENIPVAQGSRNLSKR